MEQGPRWQPTTREKVIGGTVLIVILLVIAAYSTEWTGFQGQTLWDWLQLLIVPVVIAAGGVWFNRRQQERDQQGAELQRERERVAEEARRDRELEVESQRAQDEALQAYLDHMGELLLDKERPLRQSKEGDEVQTLARAQTCTLLARLDGYRKGSVIQFLYESDLITRERVVVDLTKADLSRAELRGADLCRAALRKADLRWANLEWANLSEADMRGTHMREADVLAADLRGADMRGAYLFNVTGITNEELERQAKSLVGATMPNGQKYEEWLKDREASGGAEENSGAS